LGLREQINKKRGLASGMVGGVTFLLVIFVFWQLFGSRRPPAHPLVKMYYTADDGRTWFADDFDKVAPFDHDGSPAVHCFVFKCSSSAPFAGYLQEYTQALHDQLTGLTKVDAQHTSLDPSGEILVKKPGGKNWVLSYSPQGIKIMDVHCPGGSAERPEPVFP
jgi:hypothetical protein